jgi:hypothetical protein
LDAALEAGGALLELLPAVDAERRQAADDRAAARRYDEQDVDPTNRRGLLGGAAGVALTVAALGPAPAAAREVDPALPSHWTALLALLGAADDAHGPRDVVGVAQRELRLIADHRAVARGELRDELMRVEARWAVHAAWLCEDSGDRGGRDVLLNHAIDLAREADHPDVTAWAHARQAQWSDPAQALRIAVTGMRTPRASPQARALCAMRAAHAHALLDDGPSAEQMLAQAEGLVGRESPPPPMSRDSPTDLHDVRCWAARCWAALAPGRGVTLYDRVLATWPREEARDGALFRARLALACAEAGELDRARAEGRRALRETRLAGSVSAERELRRLGAALAA